MRFAPAAARVNDPVQCIAVRTIPPWVQDADEDDVEEARLLLPGSPTSALVAQHNHTPSAKQRVLRDSQRQTPFYGGYPTAFDPQKSEPISRWISFAQASAYPREGFDYEKVDADWLNKNLTDYATPWLASHIDGDVEDGSDKYRAFRRKRRAWYSRVHLAIMRNPFVPLVFRVVVIIFAATAMALGATMYQESKTILRCKAQPPGRRDAFCAARVGQSEVGYNGDPSAIMAIIVDAVAIVYSLYITYDEYFSKPLGLRPPAAKVRLVLLDLLFIVFQSANLSLAFNSVSIEQGPCKAATQNSVEWLRFGNVCDRAHALSGVLLISLVAWLFTFSVSILRLVERINLR